ncbi:MAG: SDR family NAD(P)-dependent oxidoreductase [Sneathiellaceae bacterium]
MRELKGKVAWITGAGTGIGAAAALAYAAAGMHLVLSGRRREKLEEVEAAIRAAGDPAGDIVLEPLDVADGDAVEAVAGRIDSRFGRLDILVNSAGINIPKRSWKEVSRAGWDQVVRIDLDGTYYCCAAALPMMRRQQDGLVINVSSWAGRWVTKLTGPAYNAAKHGVCALTESLNQEECGNGIRATAMLPGEVATPILDNRPVPVSADDRAKMVQAEDTGELCLFLARLPSHVCINEVVISPTHNRLYLGQVG